MNLVTRIYLLFRTSRKGKAQLVLTYLTSYVYLCDNFFRILFICSFPGIENPQLLR